MSEVTVTVEVATTHVFCRVEGKLARFEVATTDPQLARQTLFDALVSSGWRGGSPVLALVRGGRS